MTPLKRALLVHLTGILFLALSAAGAVWAVSGAAPQGLQPGSLALPMLGLAGGGILTALGLRNTVCAITNVSRQAVRDELYLVLAARDGARDARTRRILFERYFHFNPHLATTFGEPPQAARREALLQATRGAAVLEVGCATGGIVSYFQEKGLWCVGLDLSFEQVRHALGKAPYLQADAYRLPFPDASFDTVLVPETLEHLHDPEVALAEAARVSRDRVVVSVPVEELDGPIYTQDPTHVQAYDAAALERMVAGVPTLRLARIEQVASFLIAVCDRVPRDAALPARG